MARTPEFYRFTLGIDHKTPMMKTCLRTLANLERVVIPSVIGIAGAVGGAAGRQTEMLLPSLPLKDPFFLHVDWMRR